MDEEDYLEDDRLEDEDEHWENAYQRILNIDDFTFENLKQMSHWGKYLSFAAFALLFLAALGCGLIVLLTPHIRPIRFFGVLGFSAISLVIICTFLYPAFELYQFSHTMNTALKYPHQGRFNTAIQHLKNMLKYMGILALVLLIFSVLLFIVWLLL